jgi:hypothetical protein
VHGLDAGVALEGAFARNHFVENRAEAENVGAVIHRLSAHLLWGHVADCAHYRARLSGSWSRHGGALAGERGFADRLPG